MSAALSVRSHFSIKESMVKPERLGEIAKENGYDAIAITDTMSINGLVDMTKSCKKAGIKPIIGCRIAVYDDPAYKQTKAEAKVSEDVNGFWYAKVYAKNEAGVRGIIKLLARANLDDYFYYFARTGLDELLELVSTGDVILLTGDAHGLFSHKLCVTIASKIFAACCASNVYIEIVPQHTPLYDRVNKIALEFAEKNVQQVVATTPVYYESSDDADSLDVLGAVASNQTMSSVFVKRPYIRDNSIKPIDDLKDSYFNMCDRIGNAQAKTYNAIGTIQEIVDACEYEWKPLDVSLPKMAADESAELLRQIKRGWADRLAKPINGYMPESADLPTYKARLSYELSILRKMGFERYFLLVSDIVQWSKDNGVIVGPGRGSAGGSLVSYLIGITDVDPIRFGLIFERFINPSRLDLPDVDLDFASSKRADVIQYIKDRYGEENVAGISNYITVGSASGIRDVGRVHGLAPFDMTCTKLMPSEHGEMIDIDTAADMVPEIEKFKKAQPEIWNHAKRLYGTLRNYGKHAAGIVIAGEPVNKRAVVERRSGEMVVNWDRNSVEDWGLIKVDILGLSTLDILDIARISIKKGLGEDIDFLKIPLDDEKTLLSFAEGKSIGIFQFEGGGVRHLLKQLSRDEPLTFDDLSAATALYRPGPMDAGLMDEYVQVKQGADIYYDHPKMENALKETGGVFIFQEQVMQLATDIAGFTLAEADNLRKAMGKKDKDKMAAVREQWVEGCIDTSEMTEREAGKLFDKVEKFAGYGFNKSHSVEYAMISYWAMWLKVHYPLNFFAASMTILKEEKLGALLKDANQHGIEIYPPDINKSTDKFEIDKGASGGDVLIIPFGRLKGISDKTAKHIIEVRGNNGGSFETVAEFEGLVEARKCNSRAKDALNRAGAYHYIEPGSLPPRHPDRLKDQMELMPELCSANVCVSRKMPRDHFVAGQINGLYGAMDACEGCSLKGGVHPLPCFGKKAEIMIVTDCPTKSEEKDNKMLSGDGANFVKFAMQQAGIKPNQGYYTSLVKSPKVGKFLSNEQINGCISNIEREIEVLKPAIIVLLGSSAIKHFLPAEKKPREVMGKVIYSKELDANIVVGMNPSIIWFSEEKQDDLNAIFQTVSEIL